MEKGTCTINTWELLKAELKKQFYPVDIGHDTKKRMKELKHDGPIQEYVKEFSNLMLQISNMSDDDLFFNFMDGLKPWAV